MGDGGSVQDSGSAGAFGGGGDSIGTGGTAGTGGGGGDVECSADEEKCSENTPQRCVDGRWRSGDSCVKQTCVGGKCIGRCGPGEVRCLNNQPQWCHEYGDWEDTDPCRAAAPVCDAGKCVSPSCVGLPETCGPRGNESCCATAMVPGGTFNRGNDPAFPAMVSGFLLDRFEVTVGRFRRFVEAYPGSKPAPGAGAHPLIEGSGWDAVEFASHLPAGAPELTAAVRCNANFSTWTDEIGDHEHLPMNCLSWSVAFAFCAWDGGRLATEAEWNYAAAGGDEQRVYPWATPPGSSTIDGTYAAYNCMGDGSASGECALSDIQSVGSRSPKGDGKWGHADLAGSLQEWVLDWYDYNYKSPCNDCAQVSGLPYKMIRGGSWRRDASYLLSSYRKEVDADNCSDSGGVRCARTP